MIWLALYLAGFFFTLGFAAGRSPRDAGVNVFMALTWPVTWSAVLGIKAVRHSERGK